MKILIFGGGLVVSFILGFWVASYWVPIANALLDRNATRPAYLIASLDVLHPDQLKAFGEAVDPLARKAGFEPLGEGKPQLLEGRWPYTGTLIVQKYSSLKALLDFWRSPEHLAVKKLRDGHIDVHFVIAVEESQ